MITEDIVVYDEKPDFSIIQRSSSNFYTLTKMEREELFMKAERLYKNGEIKTSVSLYLQCLQNLEVKTAFSSLPKCLRALADHFLNEKDYEKSAHFIQAERLYYESALLDTATFQRKISEESGNQFIDFTNTDQSEILDDGDDKEERMMEYEYLVKYFQMNNQYDLAIGYGDKCLKIKQEILGNDHPSTRLLKAQIEKIKTSNIPENLRIQGLCSESYQNIVNFDYSTNKVNTKVITEIDKDQNQKSLIVRNPSAEKIFQINCPNISKKIFEIPYIQNFSYAELERILRIVLLIIAIALTLIFGFFHLYSLLRPTKPVIENSKIQINKSNFVPSIPTPIIDNEKPKLNEKIVKDTVELEIEENILDVVIKPITKTYNDIKYVFSKFKAVKNKK